MPRQLVLQPKEKFRREGELETCALTNSVYLPQPGDVFKHEDLPAADKPCWTQTAGRGGGGLLGSVRLAALVDQGTEGFEALGVVRAHIEAEGQTW